MRIASYLLPCLVAFATACPAEDDDPAGDGGSSDAEAESSGMGSESSGAPSDESSSSGGLDLEAIYGCSEPVIEARPLSGPGYDPEMGLLEPVQEQYVVSTTQILPRPGAMGPFFMVSGMVTADLEQRDGLVAYALGFEPTCGFARTISVWRDEAAMMAFAGGEAHVAAIDRTFEVGVTGRVTHFTVSADEMPVTWELAAARIAEIAPFY